MKSIYACIIVLLSCNVISAQGITFGLPIQGKYLHDFFIVNYVDLDTATGTFHDNHCGTKTYDGHEGTDFVIRNFRQMDSGVKVLAAARGQVIAIKDSLFDRNKHTNAGQLGNYIAIRHADKYFTYYGHLQKHSMMVKVGDSVQAGQPIALVGSSGNSTDPHVHFEVWYDSLYYFDPFNGTCQTYPSFWQSQPDYDSAYHVIGSGLLNYIPDIDTLREVPPSQTFFGPADTLICFWIHNAGIHKGDTSRIRWLGKQGKELFKYEYIHNDQDWWYYYWWSYIYNPHENPGVCIYEKTSGTTTTETYTCLTGVEPDLNKDSWVVSGSPEGIFIQTEKYIDAADIELMTMDGKVVKMLHRQAGQSFAISTTGLSPGVYILRFTSPGLSFSQKTGLFVY